MSDLFPIAPLFGMSTPVYLLLVLLIGVLFGFALERAGFGSAKNLTAIFVLRDFRVFRVMFTAVLTAMIGAHLLYFLGFLNLSLLSFSPNYFWSILIGGLIFGLGFYLGGFCPGTAVVAVARGRLDGLAFLVGIVFGIFVFAELYELVEGRLWFQSFYAPTEATATTLYGDGAVWPWMIAIFAAAFLGFWITPFVERRFALRKVDEYPFTTQQSPLTSERQAWSLARRSEDRTRSVLQYVSTGPQLQRGQRPGSALSPVSTVNGYVDEIERGEMKEASAPPAERLTPTESSRVEEAGASIASSRRWLAPTAAVSLLGAVVVLEVTSFDSELLADRPRRAVTFHWEDTKMELCAPTLAGWLLEEAHRVADGQEASFVVVDMREESSRGSVPIPMARSLEWNEEPGPWQLVGVVGALRDWEAPREAVLVVVADDTDLARELTRDLRSRHFRALFVGNATKAWREDVLERDSSIFAMAAGNSEVVSLAWRDARDWLSGDETALPSRLVIPGAVLPLTEVSTVVATGTGAGGGCN